MTAEILEIAIELGTLCAIVLCSSAGVLRDGGLDGNIFGQVLGKTMRKKSPFKQPCGSQQWQSWPECADLILCIWNGREDSPPGWWQQSTCLSGCREEGTQLFPGIRTNWWCGVSIQVTAVGRKLNLGKAGCCFQPTSQLLLIIVKTSLLTGYLEILFHHSFWYLCWAQQIHQKAAELSLSVEIFFWMAICNCSEDGPKRERDEKMSQNYLLWFSATGKWCWFWL